MKKKPSMNTSVVAYSHARSALVQGDVAEARECIVAALKHFAEDGRLWELLGLVERARRETTAAQDALERATTLVPLSVQGQLAMGQCYLESGHVESARAVLRHLATAVELPIDVLEPLASGLGRVNECELALHVCREAAVRMPDAAEAFIGMAHYMGRLHRPKEQIISVLFRAHHLDPENADCRIGLAWLLHACGRSGEGAYLLEVLPLDEFQCMKCLSRMRRVFETVGRLDKAAMCQSRMDELADERRES